MHVEGQAHGVAGCQQVGARVDVGRYVVRALGGEEGEEGGYCGVEGEGGWWGGDVGGGR